MRLAAVAGVAAVALAIGTAGRAPAATPEPGAAPRIVGGGPANARGWAFTVALRQRGYGFFCTGSLIAPDRVLTAAHCVRRGKNRRLRVVTGSVWAAGDRAPEGVKVRRVRVDPDYRPNLDRHDVAVLTLRRPSDAPVIALPTARESAAATEPRDVVHSAGWGARSPWGFRLAKRLKATRERVLPNRRCQRYYSKRGFQSRSMICVLGRRLPVRRSPLRVGTTSCSGDSGGPLVANTPGGPRLVGVVSAGPVPCGLGPSIYARVSDQLGFIRRAAGLTASRSGRLPAPGPMAP